MQTTMFKRITVPVPESFQLEAQSQRRNCLISDRS